MLPFFGLQRVKLRCLVEALRELHVVELPVADEARVLYISFTSNAMSRGAAQCPIRCEH